MLALSLPTALGVALVLTDAAIASTVVYAAFTGKRIDYERQVKHSASRMGWQMLDEELEMQ